MSNFSQAALAGKCDDYADAVVELHQKYEFDFVAIGLTAFIGAPLKWVYSAGATDERHRRIVLAPGHGIGGITIKSGKPMLFFDIDKEIDPREYSSYPIVFAEDLRSFCALPLVKESRVVGALLCAFRSVSDQHKRSYNQLIEDMDGIFCDLDVVADDFMDFERIAAAGQSEAKESPFLVHSEISRVISAQEEERKRISRELHDGIAQELLSVSFLLQRARSHPSVSAAVTGILSEAGNNIDRILDELHNISVELRPSALDHLGFIPALRSQAALLERMYGTEVLFQENLVRHRLNQALETQIYRICQEAMLNACKYADTDRVFVTLEKADGWLRVRVRDHGGGFNTAQPEIRGSGCGLLGMQERAKLIGASLTIHSSNEGTEIVLVAPLREIKDSKGGVA